MNATITTTSRTRRLVITGAGLTFGLVLIASPALAAVQSPAPVGGAALGNLVVATPEPVDPHPLPEPEPQPEPEPEPQVPTGPGDLAPCAGTDEEGLVEDLCDHPDPTPTPEPTDPCEEPDPERPESLVLEVPDPDGGLTRLVATPADCSEGGEGTPTFTG